MTRKFKTIEAYDVGASYIRAFGRSWPAQYFIGRILPQDVGKRVYLVGDILQVENNEQRDARLATTSAT